MEEGRIMALDVGDVRIGVAVSDPLRIIAQAHSVIKTVSQQSDAAAIGDLVCELNVSEIVVGLPLNQDGKTGAQAEKVLRFVENLKAAVACDVTTADERFTTAIARRTLIDANMSRKNRKKVVDKVAAQQILQTYMDRLAAKARAAKKA